jgi:cytochrome c551/c552
MSAIGRNLIVGSLTLVTLGSFGLIAGLMFLPGTGPAATLSADDITGTYCAEATVRGDIYVMAYDLYGGTPTPDPYGGFVVSGGPTSTPPAVGDPVRGKAVFEGAGACAACHQTTSDLTVVGPSLQNIADVAGERVEGMSAELYLRESILDPNKFLPPDTQAGLMPTTYELTLSDQDVDDLVAYMLTLR